MFAVLVYILLVVLTQHRILMAKDRSLDNLFARDYPGLVNVLGEGSSKHSNMFEAPKPFCIALYDKLR